MSPLLHPGELVLVDREAYGGRQPRLGEIVAVRPDALGGQAVVKRIAGLPNERIRFGGREWQLGEEEFFLVGDQSEHSLDSRMFGPVSLEEIIGPVTVRVWPWKLL
ncbi:MAG: S26 family signal peptidase [Candidatus Omnitrophica bacterium]|nr:S26 family signal peptidase [Candidatus Omnitrophota bacterium]